MHGRPPSLSLTHSDCRFPRDLDPYRLPSGNELGCEWPLLQIIFFSSLTRSLISPFVEVSLFRGLPFGVGTARVFRAPGKLFIATRTRQAYSVVPLAVSSFSCV